jgi:hypothetical protein
MNRSLKRGCTDDDAYDEVVDGDHLSLILGQKSICSRTAPGKRENHSYFIEGGDGSLLEDLELDTTGEGVACALCAGGDGGVWAPSAVGKGGLR